MTIELVYKNWNCDYSNIKICHLQTELGLLEVFYCKYFSKNFDIRVHGTVFYKVVEIWPKYYLKTENDNKITVLKVW